MKPFLDIYEIVEESSHETAFNIGECEALYELAQLVPELGTVLEIGVQFGRSMSVLAEVQKERQYRLFGIDAWVEHNSQQAKENVLTQMKKHNWNLNLLSMSSEEAANVLQTEIDLLHIDGDHSYAGVLKDCELWLPRVKPGGIVCFDDWEHPDMEEVKQAVNDYRSVRPPSDWNFVGKYGDKLGVFRRFK